MRHNDFHRISPITPGRSRSSMRQRVVVVLTLLSSAAIALGIAWVVISLALKMM